MSRPLRHCVLAALVATFVLGDTAPGEAAYRFDRPQARINWIDASQAPTIRIYVSFLDKRLRPVPLTMVSKLEVLRHGEDAPRGEVVKTFIDGLPEDGDDAEMLLFSKAEEQRDVVIVAVGHQDAALRDGDLGVQHRAGLGLFFKKLGATDRVNLIWYHDRLMTYVFQKGKTKELSDLGYSIEFCDEAAMELYRYWGDDPPPPEEGAEEGAPVDPCGLLEDYGRLEPIVTDEPYLGFFPRLMGYTRLGVCVQPKQDPIASKRPGASAPVYGSAIDEAFRMLVRKGEFDRPKYLILLTDGKDGYLDTTADCRLDYQRGITDTLQVFKTSCLEQSRGRRNYIYKRCLKEAGYADKQRQLKKRAESKLKKDRLIAEQQRFRDDRLTQWLALAEAANIHVFSVGYPTGGAHERERLEVLSLRTGGTYREVEESPEVGDMVSNLLDELANQYVIVFDAGLVPEETATFSLKLGLSRGGSVKTRAYEVTVPKRKGGLGYFVKTKIRALEKVVGSPLHIIIIVVGCIIALILLFVFIKLIIAMIKKVVKKGAKGAKGMAPKKPKVPKAPKVKAPKVKAPKFKPPGMPK